jgi:hypothetical protein
MRYPSFFDEAPRLTVYDPLCGVLGASEDGLVEYGYLDAVKLAGHSCPTVAGAFLMTVKALKHLYGDETPVRGDLDVQIRLGASEGVAGVIASVASLLTGAAGEGGFKGLGGRFARRDRLEYGADFDGEVLFRRRDTGAAVIASMNGAAIPPMPEARDLLQRVLVGDASPVEAAEFRFLWQDRVRRMLLERADDPGFIVLRAVPADAGQRGRTARPVAGTEGRPVA